MPYYLYYLRRRALLRFFIYSTIYRGAIEGGKLCGKIGGVIDSVAQRGIGRMIPQVGVQVFARDACRLRAVVPVQVVQMGADLRVFVGSGRGDAVYRRLAAGEKPRIAEGSAANHEAVEAVAVDKGFRLRGIADVAVGNDGQAGTVFKRTDGGMVGGAVVFLRAAAAMHGKGGDAVVFRDGGEFKQGRLVVVVTEAGFDGDGDGYGAADSGENFCDLAEVSEQCRACLLAGDGFRRAAEVDVDDVRAFGLHDERRFRHQCRVAADKLDDFRVVRVRVELQAVLRKVGVQQVRLGADHFGGAVIGAVRLAEAAKRQVADAGHRRKEDDGAGVAEAAKGEHLFALEFEQYPAVAFFGTADVVGVGVSGVDAFFLAFEQAGEDEAACGMQVFFELRAQGAQRFEEDVGDDEVHLWRRG